MSAPRRYEPAIALAGEPDVQGLAFAFADGKLLVRESEAGEMELARLADAEPLPPLRRLYLGTFDGRQVWALELPADVDPPAGTALYDLRRLGILAAFEESVFHLAGRARQLVDWDRDHQYCGRCATPTEDQETERSRRCPSCGLVHYPRLAPAVIVLVTRGDEMLLARSPHFPPGMYSTLAGFVEPGETLEQAAVREIEEEVGVRVHDLRYFGSQPWPFPNSLMIGFFARYEEGEVRPAEGEIEDAGWFTKDALPKIPPRLSIARALIDSFLATNTSRQIPRPNPLTATRRRD